MIATAVKKVFSWFPFDVEVISFESSLLPLELVAEGKQKS